MKHRSTASKPPGPGAEPMFYALQLPGWAARRRALDDAPRRRTLRERMARRWHRP